MDPILPENFALVSLFEQINQTVVSQKQGWLISQLPSIEMDITPQKCFITPEKEISGTWLPEVAFKERIPEKLTFDENEIQFTNIDLKLAQIITMDQHRLFLEPIGHHSYRNDWQPP